MYANLLNQENREDERQWGRTRRKTVEDKRSVRKDLRFRKWKKRERTEGEEAHKESDSFRN